MDVRGLRGKIQPHVDTTGGVDKHGRAHEPTHGLKDKDGKPVDLSTAEKLRAVDKIFANDEYGRGDLGDVLRGIKTLEMLPDDFTIELPDRRVINVRQFAGEFRAFIEGQAAGDRPITREGFLGTMVPGTPESQEYLRQLEILGKLLLKTAANASLSGEPTADKSPQTADEARAVRQSVFGDRHRIASTAERVAALGAKVAEKVRDKNAEKKFHALRKGAQSQIMEFNFPGYNVKVHTHDEMIELIRYAMEAGIDPPEFVQIVTAPDGTHLAYQRCVWRDGGIHPQGNPMRYNEFWEYLRNRYPIAEPVHMFV
ncbi:MAG: hypothetical protein LBB38_02885 [Puniceicoccales bacterium]|jgi:hypothetical protein|nr:hypothetical protein [Puniceicoccales bacterium]